MMLVKWSEQETELGVIGRVGENNTRKIEIDCAETLEKLPGAEIICVMLRPGDETPYTLPLEANGNKRTIVLTDTDLERRGTIRLELRAVEDGSVLKSAILRGTVADSIRGEGDAPGQPVRDVLDRVDDTLKAAEATRKELETALGGVQGAVDAATGAADAATEAAAAAEETDAQIQAAERRRVEAEKKREQDTTAAVKSITDTVTDVQNKLENGAFNGAPGAPGAPGKDGKDAPQIDDTTVSDAAPWSSQHIVDMLCPPMAESGNPVACYPVAGSKLGVTVSWEPTQEGEGTPSPDNIRPIHGRTQVKVERCGENLLAYTGDEIVTPENASYTSAPLISVDDYLMLCNAMIGKSCYAAFDVELNNVTFSSDGIAQGKARIGIEGYATNIRGKTLNNIGAAWLANTSADYKPNAKVKVKSDPFMVTADNIRFVTASPIRFYAQGISTGNVKASNFGFYLSGAGTTHTPYTGQTTTLTLPRTSYGGEVDAQTGAGQETWGQITLTGQEPYHIFKGMIYLDAPVDYASAGGYTSGVCSHYQYTRYGLGCIGVTDRPVYKPNGDYTADDDGAIAWKSYLATQYAAGTPAQIAYKLATPTPFAATGGGTIKALSGANTILTDADTITVSGRADPIHIIQQLQATSAASAQALEDDTMEITQEEAIQKENEKGMNE